MSVDDQSQVKQDSHNIRISPLPPAAVSPTNSLPSEELPNSNSPVLATMTPVSVDDFPAEYQQDGQDENGLGNKQVIYVSGHGGHQTILYDPQNPDSLGQQIIQETISTSNGPVSVVVQQPSQLSNNTSYQAPGGHTVLVVQEFVQDVPSSAIPLKKREGNSGEQNPKSSPARDGRMAELPSSQPGGSNGGTSSVEDSQNWRAYYEHPLTAATSAMLNISGANAEEQPPPPNSMNFNLYEYTYKVPTQLSTEKDKLSDLPWPTTSANGGAVSPATLLSGQLKGPNGVISSSGLEINPNQLSDLGLFLHHQPQIKREPEDLSHHRNKNAVDASKGRPKVVLVAPGSSSSELVVDVVNNNASIKEEFIQSPQHGSRSINGTPSSTSSIITSDINPSAPIELITTDGLKPATMYSGHIFATMPNQPHSGSGSPSPNTYADHNQYTSSTALATATGYITTPAGRTSAFVDPYYREYFGSDQGPYTTQVRQQVAYADNTENNTSAVATASFVERYVRQSSAYHNNKGVISAAGLTVDLPSPDSGIGADTITPRDQTAIQQSFDYAEMCQTPLLGDPAGGRTSVGSAGHSPASATGPPSRSRPWHDFGRQNDADKIQIPKLFSQYGFRYHLETAISTNQRREDDRVTYINKGQFYGITMEYVPDPDKPLKAQTVKSIVMLMFREEKSPEDEIKAWQFWHGRQHSVKQRILDADTKNSCGLVGCIEEVAHNAIAVYWNPLESPAKINIAVQCLSTDFSSQKGVKGLPLHLQIDTYEDPREGPVYHRGYCQIKVFCDKGAERKTRDEERRAAKRKMTATGRKKMDELYHQPCERSEFYCMADLAKPPVLFTPAEDIDKLTSMELQGFYGHETDASSLSNGETGSLKHASPFLIHSGAKSSTPGPQTLKFHNHFPPDTHNDKKDHMDSGLTTDGTVFSSPPPMKRAKMIPPTNERVMLYVRQDNEDVYTPLHVAPPTTQGLLNADYGQN
ncbi:protein grainyhead isoform X3 [Planococcus citri]|uniref:protein grainyhead isoform X3 n=1 Tax=Planococcus citri TaxID=170843 RepID=UPI0031F87C4C